MLLTLFKQIKRLVITFMKFVIFLFLLKQSLHSSFYLLPHCTFISLRAQESFNLPSETSKPRGGRENEFRCKIRFRVCMQMTKCFRLHTRSRTCNSAEAEATIELCRKQIVLAILFAINPPDPLTGIQQRINLGLKKHLISA